MKIEIKFRGKRVDNGEWIEGLLHEGFDGDINIRRHEKFEETEYFITQLVIPETVGQCTGLQDKNGKEIFEGDIVVYFYEERVTKEGLLVKERGYEINPVIFHNSAFVLTELDDIPMGAWITEPENECEVIGNIYDNPELLK